MNQYVALFKALSDETRFKITVLLSGGELCVCNIEEALGLSQAKVSRHLSVLRNAKVVGCRRQEQWIYYSLLKPENHLAGYMFRYFSDNILKKEPFAKNFRYAKKACQVIKNSCVKCNAKGGSK